MPMEWKKIPRLFNDDGFEPLSEKGPPAAILPVEGLCIEPVDLAHTLGEIAMGCLEKQMVMVLEETIRMTQPPKPKGCFREDIKKPRTVLRLQENGLCRPPLRLDIIDPPGVFTPRLS